MKKYVSLAMVAGILGLIVTLGWTGTDPIPDNPSMPFGVGVVFGEVGQYSSEYRNAYNPTVDGAFESLWADSSLATLPTSAIVFTVSSTADDDSASDTGAYTVRIYALLSDYTDTSEVITLTGKTEVSMTGACIRFQGAEVLTSGDSEEAAGTIWIGSGTVTDGVPAVKYGAIAAGSNSSLHGYYTVPRGYTAAIDYIHADSATDTAAVGLYVRPDGQDVFHQAFGGEVYRNAAEWRPNVPLGPYAAKTDIDLRANTNASAPVSAGYSVILKAD